MWLSLSDGRGVAGHVLAYDQESGLGLVQALARVDLPALPLGDSAGATRGRARGASAAPAGAQRSVAARIAAKQEFAGYWEYFLEEAIFTAPSHPQWGGSALIGPAGDLLGIGSLQLQREGERRQARGPQHDRADRRAEADPRRPPDARPAQPAAAALARPLRHGDRGQGRGRRPRRPGAGEGGRSCGAATSCWRSPAREARGLGDFYRRVWSLGEAGVEVPLSIYRDGRAVELRVASADRNRFLRAPRVH